MSVTRVFALLPMMYPLFMFIKAADYLSQIGIQVQSEQISFSPLCSFTTLVFYVIVMFLIYFSHPTLFLVTRECYYVLLCVVIREAVPCGLWPLSVYTFSSHNSLKLVPRPLIFIWMYMPGRHTIIHVKHHSLYEGFYTLIAGFIICGADEWNADERLWIQNL